MTQTYRVRVKPKQYNRIKKLAEEKDVAYAEAVDQLIEERNIIVGDEVQNIKSLDEKEINEVIDKLEKQKEQIKSEDKEESSGVGLVVGSVVAGIIYLLSKNKSN